MNANQFMQHLESLGACNEAKDWANGKSWQEVYDTCHRGDWLLWLYRRSKDYDFQKLTLAKGLCANTVRHLIKDERSLKAVDATIAFGKGEISIEDLNAVVAYDADAYAAYTAGASGAADAAAYAAYTAGAADAAGAAAARKENQQKTADIVREVLRFEIWEL